MKKIILLITIVLLTFGCGKNDNVKEERNEVVKTLESYAEEIFNTEAWMSGGIKEGTYSVNVKDMKEKMGYDVTMFENAECDLENTKVEFVVTKQTHNEKTNYSFNYIYDCKE